MTKKRTKKVRLGGVGFSADGLLELAMQEADVTVALPVSPGFGVLCKSLNNLKDRFTPMGMRRTQRAILEVMVKRLRVASYLEHRPEIRAIELKAPMFLASPFRTGSTLLHRLLAQDEDHRTPRLWETLHGPPTEPLYQGDPDYFKKDYRVALAREIMQARAMFSAKLAAIHPSDVNVPEECFGLIETSMLSYSFFFYAPVSEYLDWVEEREAGEWNTAYELYANQLRLLDWWAPGARWVCKTGYHMLALDALSAVFPDALIIQQHRTPAPCVASFCSLMVEAYKPVLKEVSAQEVGRLALRYFRAALSRNAAARARLGESRFIDVQFDELVRDPVGTVRSIYAQAGLTVSAELEQRMQAWRASAGGVANHEYQLEDFGLSESVVEDAFAPYSAFVQR